jgi:hypothetical protein
MMWKLGFPPATPSSYESVCVFAWTLWKPGDGAELAFSNISEERTQIAASD